jgi:hypothetical protein
MNGFSVSALAQQMVKNKDVFEQIYGPGGLQEQLDKVSWNPLSSEYATIKAQIDNLNKDIVNPAEALKAQVEATKKFVASIDALRSKGLDARVLQQIAQLGPEAGSALATELVNNDVLRESFNTAQKDLLAATQESAFQVAKSYGQAIGDELWTTTKFNSYRGLTDGISAVKTQLEADKAVWDRLFSVPAYDGFVDGAKKAQPILRDAVSDAYAAGVKKSLRTGERKRADSRTVNIRVEGNLVDPAGAAVAVRDALRAQSVREGGVLW